MYKPILSSCEKHYQRAQGCYTVVLEDGYNGNQLDIAQHMSRDHAHILADALNIKYYGEKK